MVLVAWFLSPSCGFARTPAVRRKASAPPPPPPTMAGYTAPTSAPDADLLTGLPEGVLHRIMSFLALRQAVQTCVLSRRWRNL
uniref:F-box domain-containing protein n=1 Tax=Oryza brachyantha TaxID=4533 RepID=J3N101_ORYBR